MRAIWRTVCPSRVSGTLTGAGSSSAQRGAGGAAQGVIQGSVPAALAAAPAATARANIPTPAHVDDSSRLRDSFDVQKRLKEVMAFHPLGTIFIDTADLPLFTQKTSGFSSDDLQRFK